MTQNDEARALLGVELDRGAFDTGDRVVVRGEVMPPHRFALATGKLGQFNPTEGWQVYFDSPLPDQRHPGRADLMACVQAHQLRKLPAAERTTAAEPDAPDAGMADGKVDIAALVAEDQARRALPPTAGHYEALRTELLRLTRTLERFGKPAAQLRQLDDLTAQLCALTERVAYLEGEDELHTVADSKALAGLRELREQVQAIQAKIDGDTRRQRGEAWLS